MGLTAACRGLQGWREQIARRQAIIRGEPALRERDFLRRHHLGVAIEQSLVDRGVDEGQAQILAAIAVTCFDLAIDRWLAASPAPALEDVFATVWSDVRNAMDG
ncbi:hypothetical protein [Microbacterium jepli]